MSAGQHNIFQKLNHLYLLTGHPPPHPPAQSIDQYSLLLVIYLESTCSSKPKKMVENMIISAKSNLSKGH